MQRRFCSKCGHRLVKYDTGYYSSITGKKITDSKCMNPKCEDGCENIGGHFYPIRRVLLIFKAMDETCKGCGFSRFSDWDYL